MKKPTKQAVIDQLTNDKEDLLDMIEEIAFYGLARGETKRVLRGCVIHDCIKMLKRFGRVEVDQSEEFFVSAKLIQKPNS